MVDPTSDLEEDIDEDAAPQCAVCGEPALGVGRRIITWVEASELQRRHFCDTDCRNEWEDERPTK